MMPAVTSWYIRRPRGWRLTTWLGCTAHGPSALMFGGGGFETERLPSGALASAPRERDASVRLLATGGDLYKGR